ncbi:restriction endonuclease subunit S [Selenomonas sp. AB3002]|uniref:restriction endonuclease subunit S n=1 Tax=Selenomonas sp. AB3002 TaxID=1392502 RepID=UPI001639FBA6
MEQRPEEGTAKELLKEIQAEKAQLIKEGKIKKSKTLPPITEEEKPFDIPEGWEWARLVDICWTIVDCPHSTPKYVQYKTDYAGIDTNCIDENGNIKQWRYVLQDDYEKRITRLTPECGDIVLTREGSIGRAAILPVGMNICLGQRVMLLRPADIETKYLRWFLMSPDTLTRLTAKQKGLGAKHINVSDICQITVPCPPLAEQQRIVAKIEEILPLIDKYDKAYTKLTDFNTRFPEAMKKSLLQYAIQGKLVEQRANEGTAQELIKDIQAEKKRLIAEKKIKKPKALPPITEEEIPFDIPEGWEWVRLGDICTYDQTKEKISKEEILPDMWSLDMEDIEKGSGKIINVEKAGNRKIAGDKVVFHKGDILYSKLRPYLQKILIAPADGICTSELVPFQCYGEVNNSYITWLLRSPYINQIVNTSSYGVKMPRVGKDTMVNILVPLPPLLEQFRIVEKIEELMPFCDDLMK